MNKELYYIPFERYILRTPLYPFKNIYNLNFKSKLFEEALYVASPELIEEINKASSNSSDKINKTLYKYYSRSSSRSTPFGLFATCSVGRTNSTQNVNIISECQGIKRHTRLDMNFLCELILYLEKIPYIQNKLIYYTNDSLYYVGNKVRYIEYYFNRHKKFYQVQEVIRTECIDNVLEAALSGKDILSLAKIVANFGYDTNASKGFILEMIDNQLLKSELEANITGDDTLKHLIKILNRVDKSMPELQSLIAISNLLTEIDENLDNNGILYKKIENIIKESFNIAYEIKYLFQVDSFRDSKSYLSTDSIKDLNKLLSFLLNFNQTTHNKRITSFIDAFSKRYEEQEIPLLEALDFDIGIGYPIDFKVENINPLLDGIILPINNKETISLSHIETLILKRIYQNTLSNHSDSMDSIYLYDSDVKSEIVDKAKISPTCNIMFQIINNKDDEVSYLIKSVGGATSASLLGRFCHLNKKIYDLTLKICNKEQDLLSEAGIVAEIVHLPDTRIGNIAFRPPLRNLEIHYLANSGADNDKKLPASDLLIGVRSGRLYIKSKSLNQIIIPRLSNAHNYSNGLPVYRFLCDMQSYEMISPTSININNLLNVLDYIPRICFKNFILSPRTWKISATEIIKDNKIELPLLEKKKIPQKFLIKDYDNELFIDISLPLSCAVFIDVIRKHKSIIIEEFLYDNSVPIITDGKDNYCGEFIVPFYRK